VRQCAAGAQSKKFVMTSLNLPTSSQQFTIDLNGDGKQENAFGSIVSLLGGEGFDLQANVNNGLQASGTVLLLEETGTDPNFQNDNCAFVKLKVGMATTTPGMFTVNTSVPEVDFSGLLAQGSFNSNPPAISPDTQVLLSLPLVAAEPPVPIALHGGHIAFKNDSSGLSGGVLQGGVKAVDLASGILPPVAASLTATITADPTSTTATSLETNFDLGNGMNGTCMNADGSTSAPADHLIGPCELADNPLLHVLLAADVQLFQNGLFKPSPANTNKDSISLGVGFTAVPATF
jgi:hypothetical protein